MKIVIEIDEEIYKYLTGQGRWVDCDFGTFVKAIQNGTPLPKGHGELIDKQSLKLSFFTLSRFYKTWNLGKNKIMGEIENAPAIIGASKESEDASSD